MSDLQVSELAIYPVKSLAQIPLTAAAVDRCGLEQDRRWMVVDKEGKFLTQRQYARMCLIRPELTEQGVILHAATMPDLHVIAPASGERSQVRIWHDDCKAIDCGDEAADWLSRFLEVECRLVAFPDDEIRQVDTNFANAGERTAFSDGFPLLLISQASLDDLNSRLEQTLPMKRFRPNLVISGSEPFAEDGWKRLRIGEMLLRVVKPCSRCVIPSIDPETAEKGPEPLRTLITYRKRDNRIFFGQNLIAETEGLLEVGMPVEVIE